MARDFFDLVFVVAIAQLAAGLADAHDGRGFFDFLVLVVRVWWAWFGADAIGRLIARFT